MARKTIAVADVLKWANSMLANSSDEYKEGRQGVATLLELVLTNTGNYHGFNYLEPDFVTNSNNYDGTRRVYH